MRREDIAELHYITPIANVASILRHGILSNRLVGELIHASVALPQVQDRRARVVVPGGRPLHEYANLYFHARNPMMYKRKEQHGDLCVLRVEIEVLDLPDVVVTDMNAAKDIARFYAPARGLDRIDRGLVFADDWRHPGDLLAYQRHRGIKCAEVLVADRVDPSHITGAYVSGEGSRVLLGEVAPGLRINANPHLFFR